MANCQFTIFNCLLAFCVLASAPALAIINPNFTPIHLVRQAETILAGGIMPGARAGEGTLAHVEALKGKAPESLTLGLDIADDETRKEVQRLFQSSKMIPALLFEAMQEGEKRAYLHADGMWLALKAGGPGRWDIQGYAQSMSAVYAGGTDMLARMARYILASPEAAVPTCAGTRWAGRTRCATAGLPSRALPPGTVGQADRGTDGEVAGLAVIELKGEKKPYLYVASPKGDRLFRPKDGEDAMIDVTAQAKLDTRSRRFAWIDLNRDGLADLVSWDGQAITIRLARPDGTFAPADPARTFPLSEECLGLTPIGILPPEGFKPSGGYSEDSAAYPPEGVKPSGGTGVRPSGGTGVKPSGGTGVNPSGGNGKGADRAPAILVSLRGRPFILDASGKKIELPPAYVGAMDGPQAACLVADFDNDGFPDVLQPCAERGFLWRGKAGGFGRPVESPVVCPGGEACYALGDFDGDGFLDVFASDKKENHLWENDGKGGFRSVTSEAGSLSYRCPANAAVALAADLNHDGRPDLALGYLDSGLVYHFSRGFRCFGEEGELRLVGPAFEDGPADAGVRAFAVADFNGDGSLDLAVAFARGELFVYYNDLADLPGLLIRLPKGVTGPVTVSAWQDEKVPVCVGTYSVSGHAPATFVTLRRPGQCVLRYRFPGRPAQSKTVQVGAEVKEAVLEE